MVKKIIIAAVFLLSLAGSVGITFIPAAKPPKPESFTIPTDQSVICAPGRGETTILALGQDQIKVGALGATATDAGSLVNLEKQTKAKVLSSSKRFVAGSFVKDKSYGWADCVTPRTNAVLQLANPKDSDLILLNPDESETSVDLTLLGPTGEIESSGSRGFGLSPKTSRVVAISKIVPDNRPIGVLVSATAGRVGVVGRSWDTKYGDFANTSFAGKELIIPGIPSGAKTTKLIVTNPGVRRATIDVAALGGQRMALADAQGIGIKPGHTTEIDLSKGVAEEALALLVESDLPVIASAITKADGDYALVRAVEPYLNGGLVAPAGGSFSVTNPNKKELLATVAIDSAGGGLKTEKITIGAGETWVTKPAAEKGVVTYKLISSLPTVAAVSVLNKEGGYIVPMQSLVNPVATKTKISYDSQQH
ncbi:MAG: hypothetical protein CR979_01035 [Propionibacterium sp.]|nr:MAG: hypothetical protein CR979_01035 [Propionibacterium sp.]